MFIRRAVSLLAVVFLALLIPSERGLVSAVNQVLSSVCHDGAWDAGEYCGYDAVSVAHAPDMNHDCKVDGLDLDLFMPDYYNGAIGLNLSGDIKSAGFPGDPPPCAGDLLCADGKVTNSDFSYFSSKMGWTASPCTSVPIPSVCDGTIALSFSSTPTTIVSSASQAVGAHTVYLVLQGATNATFAEYEIRTTSNVVVTNFTMSLPGTYFGGANNWGAVWLASPLSSAATTVATIDYQLTNTSPATLIVGMPDNGWGRLRWTTASASVSHNFSTVENVGINGPVPPTTGCPGTITGRVYADNANDCAFNGADSPVAGIVIETLPGGYTTTTDASGNYSMTLPSGSYTVHLAGGGVNDPWKLTNCQAPVYSVSVVSNATVAGRDFALVPLGTITGKVYADVTNNCTFNSGQDFPLAGRMVLVNPGGYVAFTNNNGEYSIKVPVGLYSLTASLGSDGWVLQSCQTSPLSANVAVGGTYPGNDFALINPTPTCDVSIEIYSHGSGLDSTCPSNHPWRTPCPGHACYYTFVVRAGTAQTTSIDTGSLVDMNLSSEFTISSVTSNMSISTVSSSGSNQQTVSIDQAIFPGQTCTIDVVATPSSGSNYVTQMAYQFDGACSGNRNVSITDLNACACDPNDLWVTPTGCGANGNIPDATPLTYNVHFENVGTGAAHNIFVKDALDADLDLSSLAVLRSDHPITRWQIENGNVLVVYFDGIELAGIDSPTQNQGSFVFTINPKPGLAEGTTIQNSAAITFDYNDPVVTNTVTNTIHAVPDPVASFSYVPGCFNVTVPTASFTYTGGTASNATFLWNFGAGATPATSTAQNPSGVHYASGGSKQVTLNVTRFGCVATAVTNISVGPCLAVCHDGIWSQGEYCGYDAYVTTTIPDMNHDCKVDALDIALFQPDIDPSHQSSDLNGDNLVNSTDFNILLGKYGQSVSSGCTSSALPDTCEGSISMSFVEYPQIINDNETLLVGSTGHAFVVVSDAPGARIVSYALEISPNIVIDSHTPYHATSAYACNPNARILNIWPPLTSNPDFVEIIDFHVTNTSPATFKIKPMTSGTACDNRIRWATTSANRSYDFTHITNAGVNGPTPASTVGPCTATPVAPREVPRTDALAQNHPNPFNPATTIEYGLASAKRVSIAVYDIRGMLVRVLVDETQQAGWHMTNWNGRDQGGNAVASGVYLYRMTAGSYTETKKLVLLK